MSVKKMALLLDRIEYLTSEGKITWEITEKDDVFQTSFSNFSLRIYKGTTDYYISLHNSEGTLLESASDLDLLPEMADAFMRMQSLYESARGYALGVEQAIDEILSELNED